MQPAIEEQSVIRFGDFELDQRSGELRKEGTRIRPQEQPHRVLQILFEVSKHAKTAVEQH